MSPKDLPTDNLYKFITLSGVVLMVVGVCFPQYMRLQYHEDYTAKLAAANEIIRSLQLQVKIDPNSGKVDEKEAARVAGMIFGESSNLKSWDQQRSEIVDNVKNTARIGMFAGCVMTVGGMFAWYLLHQRFQDRMLQAQYRKAAKEI